jgi:5-methylcytosine-specific restriction endonuclease McrA
MNRYLQVRTIERRLRSSVQYSHWAERNRAGQCVRCGTGEGLEVHHVVELYHIILGLWKFYGEWEAVFKHALAMHEDNRAESVTLCLKCHGSIHPGRQATLTGKNLHIDDWCALPRNIKLNLVPGKKNHQRNEIGLLGFQVLLGLGWHLMHNHGDRIVEFNWRRFSELLGKIPSASFRNGLNNALESLRQNQVIDDWVSEENIFEVHLSKAYLDETKNNPWFMPLADVKTSNMTVLMLRWFLGFQSSRKFYLIGREKLAKHLHLTTRTPSFTRHCLLSAARKISWVTVKENGKQFRFEFKKRGLVPIHSLRASLQHGTLIAKT